MQTSSRLGRGSSPGSPTRLPAHGQSRERPWKWCAGGKARFHTEVIEVQSHGEPRRKEMALRAKQIVISVTLGGSP